MTEKDYFDGIKFIKKFAKWPIKEKINIYGEGGWIWRKHYYEWELPNAGVFRERCSNFR